MPYTESNCSRYFSGQHPLKVAVSEVEPKEAAEFIRGCQEIYELTTNIAPDVIFFPERGASPIRWALEVFANSDGRKLPAVSLLIGEHTVFETDKAGHCPKWGERLVIEDCLRQASTLYGPLKKPLLIDEAQSGGTLRDPVLFLCSELDKQGIPKPLYVIVAQDTKGGFLAYKRAHGFEPIDQIRNKPYIKVDVVEIPLFCNDREVFLNHILYFQKEELIGKTLRQKLVYNQEAAEFITTLALAVVKPQEFDAAVFSIDQSYWMKSVVSSYSDLLEIPSEKIINWFIEYKNSIVIPDLGPGSIRIKHSP